MPFMEQDGFRLYYEDTGGTGPTVLFLHGAGGNHLSWWQQVPVFAEEYRCVTVDQRGFGQSPEVAGGPGPAALATDALAVLDHLGIGRAALVAQSMGGWTAVGAAVLAPGRFWAIVMANTVGNLTSPEIAALREELAAASPPRPPILWHAALGETFRKEQPVRAFLYAQIAGLNPPLPADFRDRLGRQTTPVERYAATGVPTLFLTSDEDGLDLARAVGESPPARPGLALSARGAGRPLDVLRAPRRVQSRSRRVPQGASAMKWCRFQSGRTVTYGIIEDSTVTEVTGSPFESHTRTATTHQLSRVKLLVPVIPPTFYAAGVNYREHVTEMAHRRGVKPEFPPAADVGYRANNALIATDEPIVIPRDATDQIQYEGELVAVIGKRAKRVSEAEALDCVFGYTIGNDVSERTWQRGDRTFWRGKNTDTFKPMGPWIVTGLDPDDLRVTIRLNGKEMFSYAVKDAIFSVRQFISRMSQYLTLHPGDVLWMGTDGATENMKDGDVVEVEVPGIGVLRNPVVRER